MSRQTDYPKKETDRLPRQTDYLKKETDRLPKGVDQTGWLHSVGRVHAHMPVAHGFVTSTHHRHRGFNVPGTTARTSNVPFISSFDFSSYACFVAQYLV